MYYIPGVAARLYRMTTPGSTWPTPLFGHGAYFITVAPKKLILTRRASEGSASEPSLARRVSMCKDAKLSCRGNTKGGRFNRANDPTVYCSEDPLVVITETAFYESLEWHRRISDHRLNPVGYPFVSRHSFWCFSIDPPPPLIDLQHSSAIAQFQFPPHMLLNPALNPRRGLQLAGQSANRDYFGTQELADEIRAYIPPAGSPNSRPEGIRAPSVRTAAVSGYQPSMLALFLFDPKLGWWVPYDYPGKEVPHAAA